MLWYMLPRAIAILPPTMEIDPKEKYMGGLVGIEDEFAAKLPPGELIYANKGL